MIDNGQFGYAETGTGWLPFQDPLAYNDNERYVASGTGTNTATWTASNLAVGSYDLEMSWTVFINRADNATYQIFDGTTLIGGQVQINQQLVPTGGQTINGIPFQSLGQFKTTTGTLSVVLSDNADGYVIAQAMLVGPYTGLDVIDNGQSGFVRDGFGLVCLPGCHRLQRQRELCRGRHRRQHDELVGVPTNARQLRLGDELGDRSQSRHQRDLPDFRWPMLLGTVQVNQQVPPTGGQTVNSVTFQSLGTFNCTQRRLDGRALGQRQRLRHGRRHARGAGLAAR